MTFQSAFKNPITYVLYQRIFALFGEHSVDIAADLGVESTCKTGTES